MEQLHKVLAEINAIEIVSAECANGNLNARELERAMLKINARARGSRTSLKTYFADNNLSTIAESSSKSSGDNKSIFCFKEAS